MNRITLKKAHGTPVALLINGPQAEKFPGVFVNLFASERTDESELPLVYQALCEAIEWAQTNSIEIKVHPTVEAYFTAAQQKTQFAHNAFKREIFANTYTQFARLYPHQVEGVEFVIKNAELNNGVARVLLADDPRLGKSPLALASLFALDVKGPVLVLCPKALITQWVEYVKEWLPYSAVRILTGSSNDKRKTLLAELEGFTNHLPLIFITNWESLRGVEELQQVKWVALIGDEAHKLKNRKTEISTAIRKIQAHHIILLSATFVENLPNDWWNPLNIIQPRLFTSYWRWVGNYVDTKQTWGGLEFVGAKQTHIMKLQTEPHILQRRSDDVADMPPKLYEHFQIELEGEHLEFYKDIENKARILYADGTTQRLPNKISAIMAMRQAAIHPALCDGQRWEQNPTGKLALLAELLENYVPANEQVIVFSSFVIGCLTAAYSVKGLGGAATFAGPNANYQNVEMFKLGKVRTLCATPQKGGVGLNLFNANWIFWLDYSWSTVDIRQSEERARAIGKHMPVTIVRLTAKNTIDEYVTNHVMNKLANVAESEVISSAERWLSGN